MSIHSPHDKSAQQRLAVWWVVGVVTSVVVNVLVAHAIYESPVGTMFILDEAPPDGSFTVPLLAGVAIALLQAIAFNIRISLVAALVGVFGRLAFPDGALDSIFTALVIVLGSVLGWLLAAVAGRRSASWTRLAAVVALAIIAMAAAISLLMA